MRVEFTYYKAMQDKQSLHERHQNLNLLCANQQSIFKGHSKPITFEERKLIIIK